MPLIQVRSQPLSSDQKKRLGEAIIAAFHNEGMVASSVVVLFTPDPSDILLEGGLLFEGTPAPVQASAVPAPDQDEEDEPAGDYRHKARRSKAELVDLKKRLLKLLETEGALTSFQAQEKLQLKACDWAPATLRRFFLELEQEGHIVKQGQKRGTRYVLKGTASQSTGGPLRLVKPTGEGPDGDA